MSAVTRVLVVGGDSRAARAFRRVVAKDPTVVVSVLVRRATVAGPREIVHRIDDYFSPPAAVLADTDALINFVGSPNGSSATLFDLNAAGPERLAKAAKAGGARHFIQISSLSIFGPAEDIYFDTLLLPHSAYGHSKLAAEERLSALADDLFLVSLVRAPLIYGPDGGGKLTLLRNVFTRTPLFPVPPILEPRSMIHVDNLAFALLDVIKARAGGATFACDPQPFDLGRFAEGLRASGRPAPRLVTFPSEFFAILRRMAPNIHASLYGRSLIHDPGSLPQTTTALPLDKALQDVIDGGRRGKSERPRTPG